MSTIIPKINVITPPTNVGSVANNAPIEAERPLYNIVNVFEKTIELDELSLVAADSEKKTQNLHDVASVEYPLIKINQYFFNKAEIIFMKISCENFLPQIVLSVTVYFEKFMAREFPKDGDILSIAIRNKSDILKIIRNDYVITSVQTSPNITEITNSINYIIYGELFIPGLKSQTNNFSFEGTSYYALMDFAKKYKLGFSSNEDDTNDRQVWLKANMAGDVYVNHVTERSWRDNESFYISFIDIYYNLNFININKQLISREEVGISTLISNIDTHHNYGLDSSEESSTPTPKVFCNIQQLKSSSFFINNWTVLNRSTQITFDYGTKIIARTFEHNKYLYEDYSKKKDWAITIEPTYDIDKLDRSIILRGRSKYIPHQNNTEPKLANNSYVDLYQKSPWMGIQYTISNPDDDIENWDGNHHKSYKISYIQNLLNKKELEKLNIHINVAGNNFNVIKYDKIPVILLRSDAFQNLSVNPDTQHRNIDIDRFYSGWYIIKGFSLIWNQINDEDIQSNFTQEFILTRREWPTPMPVEPLNLNTENAQAV